MLQKEYTITVRFDGYGQGYDYKTLIEGLAEGDKVVVEARDSYGLATVSRIHTSISQKATKWAFQKVDLVGLGELKARQEEIKKLEKLLKDKVEQRSLYDKYKEIASQDSEAKEALARLTELGVVD